MFRTGVRTGVFSARLVMLTATAFGLSACGTRNRGLESVHQPVVERTDYAFDVATDGETLAPGETERLQGWMAALRLGFGDRVAVDTSGSTEPGVRDAVASQAARYGLLVSDDVPLTTGQVASGTARVVVSRMKAVVPGCPDHSRVSGTDLEGHTESNYGCAINSNLAAMIARPEDLVRGEPGTGVSDPAVAYKSIETLRRSPTTGAAGLPAVSTRSR